MNTVWKNPDTFSPPPLEGFQLDKLEFGVWQDESALEGAATTEANLTVPPAVAARQPASVSYIGTPLAEVRAAQARLELAREKLAAVRQEMQGFRCMLDAAAHLSEQTKTEVLQNVFHAEITALRAEVEAAFTLLRPTPLTLTSELFS